MDTLGESYRLPFGGRLAFGTRPALLLVDIVMAYLEPGSSLYDPAFVAALDPIERLTRAARATDVPVIFTSVVYQAGGRDGGLFYQKVPALKAFDAGSPLAAFPPSPRPAESETVIVKQYASAFFGTSLASTLTAQRIDTLVLCGFSTSGCVRATALDALQNGFAPFVVREACADRHAAPHEANLFDLQAKYAEVIGIEQAIGYLDGAGPARRG